MSEQIPEIWKYIIENYPQLTSMGVLGFLVGQLTPHLLAKSRSKEDFQRKLDQEKKDQDKTILSLIGVLANDILNCWEEGTVFVAKSKFGPQDMKISTPQKIKLKDYEKLKHELVIHGVFSPMDWHSLDKLPEAIDRINESIETRPRGVVFVDCFHFSEMCKSLWILVLTEYTVRGGDVSKLALPMPLPSPQN